MAAVTHTPSMLEDPGERIPTRDELDATAEALAYVATRVENLQITLRRQVISGAEGPAEGEAPHEPVVLNAAAAWHLRDFAASIEARGNDLREIAENIVRDVDTLHGWSEARLTPDAMTVRRNAAAEVLLSVAAELDRETATGDAKTDEALRQLEGWRADFDALTEGEREQVRALIRVGRERRASDG
jgi:hypothetical protein